MILMELNMLEKVLKNFLKEHADLKMPLLLGLSGGPDSMALFHLLLKLAKSGKLTFAVAHVNHNWRKESALEALKLQAMVKEAGISFHLHILNPQELKGNLELACRNERLKFFTNLLKDFGYQAVILGHHLNDQSETVLKRLFEGAFLPKLKGLTSVKKMGELLIFRPFLKVSKSCIESWLKTLKIEAFDDATNYDEKFMRARFRQTIIPFLNETFGKDISQPLFRLGTQAFELEEYLQKSFAIYKDLIVRGPLCISLKFPTNLLIFEIKYLIRMFAEDVNLLLTYPLIETIAHLIQSNAANKKVQLGKQELFIDRGTLEFAVAGEKRIC